MCHTNLQIPTNGHKMAVYISINSSYVVDFECGKTRRIVINLGLNWRLNYESLNSCQLKMFIAAGI